MNIIGVIPARYASTRFPGKPLVEIEGKPMVWWVYQEAKKSKYLQEVYVATESEKVESVCKKLNINVILTSDTHPTGTDRVCEVSEKIKADLYTVIMGDEPLIKTKDIDTLIQEMLSNTKYDGGMLTKKYTNPVDVINPTTIKLALNNNNELIYMSRQAIPFPKGSLDYDYYKNIGVYIFTKNALNYYKENPVGKLEKIEELEMLRMLEGHKLIKVVEIESDSFSVDTQKDLQKIKEILKTRRN